MKPADSKGKLKYLKAVADYFIEQGYGVEAPKSSDDCLDVWGFLVPHGKRRRKQCFQEIYLSSQVFDCGNYFYACWNCGDNDAEVTYRLDYKEVHSYDNFEGLLEGLEPLKRKAKK